MPKLALVGLLGLLAACSSAPVAPFTPVPSAAEPSPEADPRAPGMIPKDCEALLNKSQEWGFSPEVAGWKPKTAAQALEAAEFFSTFHLVPESTSNFAYAWLKDGRPSSDLEARKSLEKMAQTQTCDLMLTHKLLLGVVNFPWAKADREKAARFLHSFALNQQARVAPSLARAVQIDVVAKLAQRHLLRVDPKSVAKIQQWFEAETRKSLSDPDAVKTDREQWEIARREYQLSEEARERLGKLLPLP